MKSLPALLGTRSGLTRLCLQLHEQERLLNQVRALLPSPLDQYCSRAIPRDGVLVLLATSSAWASRLRYLSAQLMQQLAARKLRFKRIQVRVLPPESPVSGKQKPRHARLLSSTNADMLRSTAECVSDKNLKQALLRLSRHSRL